MKNPVNLFLAVAFNFMALAAISQNRPEIPVAHTSLNIDFINRELKDAVSQVKVLSALLPKDAMPRTFVGDTLVTSNTSWWTSGFYPGLLLYLYDFSGDSTLFHLASNKMAILEKEKYNTGTHDLGFMLYCSYGNALRITHDTAKYKNILVTGAESLASRYRPKVGAIRSWNMPSFPVIIDNMMNLELLLVASRLSGNIELWNIAVAHANTTMKNHFRPDYSCYHVVDYDPENGNIIAKKTAQGAYDESAWARGQAWALYGYTMMYRETRSRTYLDFAKKIAGFILDHPNMPADLIPYWDFDTPQLPDNHPFAPHKKSRDASAAAIIASALIELSTYTRGAESDAYLSKAEKMLTHLAQYPYKAAIGSNGGFILQHSMGSLPRNVEVDVPLTYADYYYVEALMRYRQLLQDRN